MFQRFRTARRNREIVDQVFETLVVASRGEALYRDGAIPDTVMGRFEALSIHVFLFLRRCRETDALAPIAQDLVDRFITDIEASIRELGVGDPSVPKRMRKLAGIFYERVAAYDGALDGADRVAALSEAVKGRAVDTLTGEAESRRLASYMAETLDGFQAVPATAILAGRFQPAGEAASATGSEGKDNDG